MNCSSESSSDSSEGEESADEEPISPPVPNFSRIRSDSIPVDIPPAGWLSSHLSNCKMARNPIGNFLVEEVDATSSQATMWLGTEDGCIHIYHCGENIRLKKNRVRIQQGAAVLSIV